MEDFESILPFFAYRDEGEGGGHEMKVSMFTQHLLLSAWKGATQGVWKQVHQRVQNFQGCRRETFISQVYLVCFLINFSETERINNYYSQLD